MSTPFAGGAAPLIRLSNVRKVYRTGASDGLQVAVSPFPTAYVT